MKRLQFILPLIVIACLLGGCPYQSKVPVSDATEKINPSFLGKWEKKNSGNDVYILSKVDDFHYRLEKQGEKKENRTTYLVHTNTVDGDLFLNLMDESDKETYFIYKAVLNSSANKITLSEVTENIDEKFATAAEFKAFIQKYKGLSFFYSKQEDIYYKAD